MNDFELGSISSVLMAAPEIAPFAKTGGLADVLGALPPALAALGLDVRLVMPLYSSVDRRMHQIEPTGMVLEFPATFTHWSVEVFQGWLGPCRVYFLSCPDLYDRPHLYGPPGGEYGDNLGRFTVFCRAVVELARALDYHPDVVHVHDWQAALLPAYIKTRPFDLGPLEGAGTLLTIHNMAYQGVFGRYDFGVTGLPDWFNTIDGAEYYGNISLLKAGLMTASAINTVSPSYAGEIRTDAGGHGMAGVLNHRGSVVHGILNGADYGVWSPEGDAMLPAQYTASDMSGKQRCRQALLGTWELNHDNPPQAVLGFVGRMEYQKGVDLIADAIHRIMNETGASLAILGTGQYDLVEHVRYLCTLYPGRVALLHTFSEELAHLLVAGSDLLLMPSRYEPCGLSQLYAMRYGTPPLVRRTGGLGDTVHTYDPATGEGTGFSFFEPSGDALANTVRHALDVMAQPEAWTRLVRSAMSQDFSWERSARRYAELYSNLK